MENETNMQNNQNAGNAADTAQEQGKTFTQADVDALIQKRLERERKKYPTEEELTAFRSWKESQQTEKEKMETLKNDRDSLSGKLTAAENERDQMKRELYVLKKGVTGEEAEFIVFKAQKMVNDKTTFEQAVDTLTAEKKPPFSFDWSAQVGEGSKGANTNGAMNALIRSAFK